jgi:hypothetical protein
VKAIAEFKASHLFLNGLSTLDAGNAKVLAEFKGSDLYLRGLTAFDAEAVKALMRSKAWSPSAAHLTTLDVDTVEALAANQKWDGALHGLTTLTIDIAKVIAPCTRWDGRLPGITAFEAPDSFAVAEAIATRKRPLSLPNLKRISPKTLTTLIQKRDVEIPLIETLELIPEPDGSSTEDFVIPDDFKQAR